MAVLAGFMASAASVLAFTAGAGLGLLWLSAVTARLADAPADHWSTAVRAGRVGTTKMITTGNGSIHD
ncbi:hypothetical protein [Streptomyces bacillaris]|uniref:hypothetical protein n=1 Tax=Streptomyces bacillaris TaxID=68179 RepID=UPI0034662205